jgi:hypothetical protein
MQTSDWAARTPVICIAVSMTPLRLAYRCHWHFADMHRGVNDLAVQIWHCCDFGPHISETLATLKGNIYQKNIHRQIVLHYIYNFHTQKYEGLK